MGDHEVMATPRSLLVDPEQPLCYHLVSRCVRRAWLCGCNGERNYAYRKRWIEQRLIRLAEAFALDVLAFAIMSNHFHLVVYFDPNASKLWSLRDVAERWLRAFPVPDAEHEEAVERLLTQPARLHRYRERLGSLSAFMQHLKQPIAVRINREDSVKGHLFEQRFYSGALLDENAVLTAMRYVDLNPFRARITQTLQQAEHTSIQRRLAALANAPERMDQYLEPLVASDHSGKSTRSTPHPHDAMPQITLRDYIALLEQTMEQSTTASSLPPRQSKVSRWRQAARLLRKQQRAYGQSTSLCGWLRKRNFRPLDKAFDAN